MLECVVACVPIGLLQWWVLTRRLGHSAWCSLAYGAAWALGMFLSIENEFLLIQTSAGSCWVRSWLRDPSGRRSGWIVLSWLPFLALTTLVAGIIGVEVGEEIYDAHWEWDFRGGGGLAGGVVMGVLSAPVLVRVLRGVSPVPPAGRSDGVTADRHPGRRCTR
ncbi:MAG: hypothetical protein OEW19_02060 [Acidobacteriota bacterium]|nr:hypothetical protein [Acidobacteriota bacterium]